MNSIDIRVYDELKRKHDELVRSLTPKEAAEAYDKATVRVITARAC